MLSFHVKFVQTDRQTARQVDGQTDSGKTICPPSFEGHKKLETSTIMSIFPQTTSNIWYTFILSANAYKLDKSNILLFSKASIHVQLVLHLSLYSLPNDHFGLFETERVCRQQFQMWWKWRKVLQTGRKHCGKRRNCLLWAISSFPTVFSKGLYCRRVKSRACLGKGSLFTKQQNFGHNQTESICRRQNKCTSNDDFCLSLDRNIVGKGENAGY